MTVANDRPQLVMNFEVNAGGQFPNEMPETSPTISNSSRTADAFNVKFDAIVVGDRRVRIRDIDRVRAGETVASQLTVHGPNGEQLPNEAGRNLSEDVLTARWKSVLKGNLGAWQETFVSRCTYQDATGTRYETESVIQWEPLWIRTRSAPKKANSRGI